MRRADGINDDGGGDGDDGMREGQQGAPRFRASGCWNGEGGMTWVCLRCEKGREGDVFVVRGGMRCNAGGRALEPHLL